MQGLEELSLADNELREVAAGALMGLTSLKRLHLFGNRLEALPLQALQELPQLQVCAGRACMAVHCWLHVGRCEEDQVLVLLLVRCWIPIGRGRTRCCSSCQCYGCRRHLHPNTQLPCP